MSSYGAQKVLKTSASPTDWGGIVKGSVSARRVLVFEDPIGPTTPTCRTWRNPYIGGAW